MVATPISSRPQIRRVVRYYKRFEELNSGVLHDRPTDEREDDVYAFFLNCYHLKDWIKKDTALAPLGHVEHFVHGKTGVSPCRTLQICGDICNGAKHFIHDNKSKVQPQPGPKHFALDLSVGAPARVSVMKSVFCLAARRTNVALSRWCLGPRR